jgi:hypothetical protein
MLSPIFKVGLNLAEADEGEVKGLYDVAEHWLDESLLCYPGVEG